VERKPLTEAGAREREERLRAAGITVVNPETSTVTLLTNVAEDDRAADLLEDDDGSGVVQ
jgi:hypothetical protein